MTSGGKYPSAKRSVFPKACGFRTARRVTCAIVLAFCLGIAGCEDSAQHTTAYRPPPIAAPAPPPRAIQALPVTFHPALPSLVPVPDAVALLVKQVTALVEQGEREYAAGDLAAAREGLGGAMDTLVASGFDFQEDARISALQARIVESQNRQQASSAQTAATASVASPLDEIDTLAVGADGNPAVPADPNLLAKTEGELREVPHDLPLTVNDVVLSYVNFFQTERGRAIVETGLRRAGRYRQMIEQVLREEGLPSDLIYIAQAESAFQPQALSRAGARGLWQFMSYRGREYGLEHTSWVDERQDPEKATRAAAHHLRDLYQMFGDWYLTMAAYNSGPGTVQSAVERTGYADFWELYNRNALPKETKNYVPIILALTLIAKDPARYGIQVDPEPPLRTDDVQPGHAINLRLVSDAVDADLDAIRELNPQLLHLATPDDPAFVLHLPLGTSAQFQDAIAAIPPNQWTNWRLHRVEESETLASIGRQYRLTAGVIAEANDLDAHDALETGRKLVIPVAAQSQPAGKLMVYRVRASDTVASIADEFDVSVAELTRWNRLRSNQTTVAAGTRLRIYPGGLAPAPSEKPASSAAAKPPAQTAQAAAKPEKPTASGGTARQSSASAEPAAPEAISYHVRAGETLWSIAKAYQTTVETIEAGNKFLFSRPLQAGDTLVILRPH
jgi:membrane-bound lytic murein transglycosylase D